MNFEQDNLNGGLQMLLERWKLQEQKLQAFEESLKEVNNLVVCQHMQEKLGDNISQIKNQNTSFISSNNVFDKSVYNKINCMSSVSNITLNDNDFENNLYKDTYVKKNIDASIVTNQESMKEFEKRIWEDVWKSDAILNDDFVKESSNLMPKDIINPLNNNGKRIIMESKQPNQFLMNDLKNDDNAIIKDINSHCIFQEDFHKPILQTPTPISHDDLSKLNFKDRQSNSMYTSLEEIELSCKFKNDDQNRIKDFEDMDYLFECKKFQVGCEKVESIDMVVNLVNVESSSSLIHEKELNNINELSKQRATFVENIMAIEAKRQLEREKEQQRKNEALKFEEELAANLEVSVFLIKRKKLSFNL